MAQPDAPGPDIAAQIDHATRTLKHLEAMLGWPQGGSTSREIETQRAILRTLEAVAAMVAAAMIEPGLIARLYQVAKGQMP